MFFSSLRHRQREPEWMDDDRADGVELERSLAFIERVNRCLSYTRSTISHLDRMSARWEKGRTYHLLDIATGSADVPRAILEWADGRGLDVRIVGVDRHAKTLDLARRTTNDPRVVLMRADALDLPFGPESFDYVLCSMFLHHLSDEEASSVIASAERLSTRGWIIADLIRSQRAYAWISLFTMLSNPMVKHDARVSVKQAFTRDEILTLCDHTCVTDAKYHRHFGHRFVLTKEKNL